MELGQFTVGIVHGHQVMCMYVFHYIYQIIPYGDEEALIAFLREIDCDLLIYGHTHTAKISQKEGKYLVSPGSMTGAFSPFNP